MSTGRAAVAIMTAEYIARVPSTDKDTISRAGTRPRYVSCVGKGVAQTRVPSVAAEIRHSCALVELPLKFAVAENGSHIAS